MALHALLYCFGGGSHLAGRLFGSRARLGDRMMLPPPAFSVSPPFDRTACRLLRRLGLHRQVTNDFVAKCEDSAQTFLHILDFSPHVLRCDS